MECSWWPSWVSGSALFHSLTVDLRTSHVKNTYMFGRFHMYKYVYSDLVQAFALSYFKGFVYGTCGSERAKLERVCKMQTCSRILPSRHCDSYMHCCFTAKWFMAKTTEQVGKMKFVNVPNKCQRIIPIELILLDFHLAARSDAHGTTGGVTRFGNSWGQVPRCSKECSLQMLNVRRIRMNLGFPCFMTF